MDISSNSILFLQAINGNPIKRSPVWIMRQAGRYMKEYRALKQKYSFLEICKNPNLAFEISMQPMRAFDPDAAIVFADILLPLEGMGFAIDFSPMPIIKNQISSRQDVQVLVSEHGNYTEPTAQTIGLLKRELSPLGKAVIGFSGSPWTLACYAIARGPYKNFQNAAIFAKSEYEIFEILMKKITSTLCLYLKKQCEAGADVIQIFDSWGGILNLRDYKKFSLPWIKVLIEKLKRWKVPSILFVGNGAHLKDALSDTGANCLSLDWRDNFTNWKDSHYKCFQGNIDPTDLFLPEKSLTKRIHELLNQVPEDKNLIANLGHGILQTTDTNKVDLLVKTVKGVLKN